MSFPKQRIEIDLLLTMSLPQGQLKATSVQT